jgi:predicted site-specific integrase-resolvase
MSVLQHFEEYQKARVKFVQAVAEAATRPQNIEVMNNAGVMQLLRPLLLDNVKMLNSIVIRLYSPIYLFF